MRALFGIRFAPKVRAVRVGVVSVALILVATPPANAEPRAAKVPAVAPLTFESAVWRGLPERGRQLFTQFAQVAQTFSRHAADIWATSFRPDKMPHVLGALPAERASAPGYAYAIGHPRPAELGRATSVDLPRELGLPPVYRIDDGPVLGKLAEIPFYEVDDAGVVSFNYGKGADFDPATWLLSRIDVHEAFHHYQGRFRPAVEQAPDPLRFPRGPAEVHGLGLLEDRVLAADSASPRELLRMFLAVRAARYELEPGVRALERQQDQWEGTARFTEDRYVELGGQQPEHDDAIPHDRTELFFHLAGNRSYAVGSSIGRLLEQVSGPAWRELVAAGAAPHEAAVALVGEPNAGERASLVQAAKEAFGYPELLDKVTQADFPNLRPGEQPQEPESPTPNPPAVWPEELADTGVPVWPMLGAAILLLGVGGLALRRRGPIGSTTEGSGE